MQIEKRPRHYAAELVALETKEQRIEALKKVPAHLQDMVKTHLKIYWQIKSQSRSQQ